MYPKIHNFEKFTVSLSGMKSFKLKNNDAFAVYVYNGICFELEI